MKYAGALNNGLQTIGGTQNGTPSQSENDTGHDTGATFEDKTHTMLDYLRNSLTSDLERVKTYRNRKTGYSNIDRYNSLFPGLYVIGGVTGNGTTTFCGQMADNLARAGESVLYFSLEQTELELVTKGLARLTAQECLDTYGAGALTKSPLTGAMSAIDIRAGRITDSVKRAIETYKTFADRLRIIECKFDITADMICNSVCNFMNKHNGVKPVVFVDYLPKREAVDDTVQRFKKFSAEADIPVFIISSLNRQNYLTVVDFESFKETGGIEYTADVVWGLQLRCMNASIFNTDKDLLTKRKFVRKHKRAKPRLMELCELKTRYSGSSARYFFDYYSEFDLFIPYEAKEPDKTEPEDFAEEVDTEIQQDFEAFKENEPFETSTIKSARKPKRLS